jgi:hypothetical protein
MSRMWKEKLPASGEYRLPDFFCAVCRNALNEIEIPRQKCRWQAADERRLVCVPQIYQRVRFYSTGLTKLL